MGFADINLSEFAGSGFQIHHSILEMYDSRASKPDNSILKVGIQMQLLAGDPCFRVPASTTNTATLPEVRPSVSNASTEPQGTSRDFGGVPSSDSLLQHFEVCGSLSPEAVPQDVEQQERVAVAGQLSRVGKTRVDARDVVENLCLENLSQETDLVPPAEDGGLVLYVGPDGQTSLGQEHNPDRQVPRRFRVGAFKLHKMERAQCRRTSMSGTLLLQ
ncbi:early estrogen-induced gene 1 protein-like [Acipenser ruthenus]|uniref:early estrogen-induced gene 1 protein-like n=1 Tax=Acipenser ruthenus TaxID=7906 RepID=UPI002740CBB2|nr:early estrogen-induced gene 1 protein-like [Acipenser ruthenus]